MNVGLLLTAALFVVYALTNRWLSRSSLTGPMLFTIAGVIVAQDLLGAGVALETFALELDSEVIQVLLEGTLALILFSDAVLIDYRAVRREAFLPGRLLGIGLPLTIAVGTLIAYVVFPELGFWSAAVVAVILAPTDAALGQAVVSNDDVPDLVRQGLGVESGLNDGIAVPFLTITVAGAANEMQNGAEILTVFVEEIGYAVVIGLLVGYLGAIAARFASDRGWTGREGRQVLIVFLAILAYAVADGVGGSGFIAAFVGGLAFGAVIRKDYPDITHFSEGVAHLLTMVSFLVFGALILGPTLELIDAQIVIYAVLSLTVIRMIPVALALIGTGLRFPTQMYIGWFGPRGLASLVFLATVVFDAEPDVGSRIFAIGAATVGLSVMLHGLSAWPASIWYARWYARTSEVMPEEEFMEAQDVEIMPKARIEGRMWTPNGG